MNIPVMALEEFTGGVMIGCFVSLLGWPFYFYFCLLFPTFCLCFLVFVCHCLKLAENWMAGILSGWSGELAKWLRRVGKWRRRRRLLVTAGLPVGFQCCTGRVIRNFIQFCEGFPASLPRPPLPLSIICIIMLICIYCPPPFVRVDLIELIGRVEQ